MIRFLAKISNWKSILFFFLLTAGLLFLFVQGQNQMSEITGKEVTLIDLWKKYTLTEVTTFFEELKPEGRAIHQQLTGVHDMIFPFAYGPLFILIFAFFLKNIFGEDSKWLLLSLFPIVTMGVDYMENLNTLEMLKAFPNITETMASKGSFYLEMKNLSSLIRNVLFVLLGLAFIVKKVKNR